MDEEIRVVNVVGSGNLGRELDIEQIFNEIDLYFMQYEPEIYPGLQLRLGPDNPLITIYTTGSYTIVGAESYQELQDSRSELLQSLVGLGVIEELPGDDPFAVRNIVCVYNLGRELDLAPLAIGLGLENTEYEPEQSPFLVYRPRGLDLTMTIPSNGKLMITGLVEVEKAREAINRLRDVLNRNTK